MSDDQTLFLGLDFGTESVRAVLVDRRGNEAGSAVAPYAHGQIVPGSPAQSERFPSGLPAAFALQDPDDWLTSAGDAVRNALALTSITADHVAAIGVDFTSCTVLPCSGDGAPLCRAHPDRPHAWPKLWKHHGAVEQTERINQLARERAEPWLPRYGGIVGLEWSLPKLAEVCDDDPETAGAIDLWIEGGDWFVWQLVGGPEPKRSTCQAGYKALWSAEDGYPGAAFVDAVSPGLGARFASLMRGELTAPGRVAGELTPKSADRLGLRSGIPVSAAIIDAHAGVPGAGVADAGALVMVMGTSGCHMLLADEAHDAPGVAGIVQDGILPGFVGYETGQAAMGDAFELARRLTGSHDFATLERAASGVAPGAAGVRCLDWFNGCRTPLMDGSLKGAFAGLTLAHGPEHLYRSTLEASACGLRWIVETLRDAGVPVTRFVATGGLPARSPLFMEIVASVLGAPVEIHAAANGPALGAAILAAVAAESARGGYDNASAAVHHMAGGASAIPAPRTIAPTLDAIDPYNRVYADYRSLGDAFRGVTR